MMQMTSGEPDEPQVDLRYKKNKIGRTRSNRSLQKVLLVVVLLSIAFPALISGSILIRENYNRTITYDSRIKADNYIDILQAGMTLPLWNISPGLGRELINVISIDKSVLSILVTTNSEAIFLSYQKQDVDVLEDAFSISRKIAYEGDILGEVSLVYSLKEARNRAKTESRLILTNLTVQLVFSVALMGYCLRKWVIGPLSQLERSAAGIADGDLETQIPELNSDEFGSLSNQLERMRGGLSRAFHELEKRVRERTAELVDVNEELQGTLDKLRHAQGELVQQEKLAALGSLVAGIAHELNTPIGNGLTVASSLAKGTQEIISVIDSGITRSTLDHYLKDMYEGSNLVCMSLEKASELVSSFKQVAVDRTSAQRRRFLLSSLLNEIRVTMATLIKHMPYTLEISEQQDFMLDGYPGPLGQVITNLLNNALLHGFDEREDGKITISTSPIPEGVQIEVEDNGHGIESADLSHIFDPFFTTKLGDGGNGLGLHIVHNIVTIALGGTIDVHSEVNSGTKFVVKMPLVAPKDGEDGLAQIASSEKKTS